VRDYIAPNSALYELNLKKTEPFESSLIARAMMANGADNRTSQTKLTAKSNAFLLHPLEQILMPALAGCQSAITVYVSGNWFKQTLNPRIEVMRFTATESRYTSC